MFGLLKTMESLKQSLVRLQGLDLVQWQAGKSPVTIAAYSVAGMVVGHTIGAHFDKVDQIHATLLLRQTLSSNADGQLSNWTNEKKGFSVTQGPVATKGNCREFVSNVAVGKEYRKLRGTACRENNQWIMKEVY